MRLEYGFIARVRRRVAPPGNVHARQGASGVRINPLCAPGRTQTRDRRSAKALTPPDPTTGCAITHTDRRTGDARGLSKRYPPRRVRHSAHNRQIGRHRRCWHHPNRPLGMPSRTQSPNTGSPKASRLARPRRGCIPCVPPCARNHCGKTTGMIPLRWRRWSCSSRPPGVHCSPFSVSSVAAAPVTPRCRDGGRQGAGRGGGSTGRRARCRRAPRSRRARSPGSSR